MLGENHSLLNEFPEHKALILELVAADQAFADDARQHDDLDKEIRMLELADSPIDDAAMRELKHQRAVLKDRLYQRLLAEG